ncbi:MAG: TIM barrel protein [Nanoarchaeota archaeon]
MKGEILFGPAGLGPVKTAEQVLEKYHKLGLRACEIAFTYSVYIKSGDAVRIGEIAKKFGIELSIHAQYWVNLNSAEKEKREATKQRILQCCEIGELLGAKVVVFHPGYYGDDRIKAYDTIKEGIIEIMKEIKKKGWKIQIAPETMGKINVFGSIDEISRLAKETGSAICIDFAHILARDKKVDYKLIEKSFPQKEWHVHFSGIVYGEKGEKHHIKTEKKAWKELIDNLPKDRKIRIVNESPEMVEDAVEGMKIYNKI